MQEKKYKIGDIFNNRKLVGFGQGKYIIKCLNCGKETRQCLNAMMTKKCPCTKKIKKPLNKKLQAMKEKYKNGVTIEHLKE